MNLKNDFNGIWQKTRNIPEMFAQGCDLLLRL